MRLNDCTTDNFIVLTRNTCLELFIANKIVKTTIITVDVSVFEIERGMIVS